MGPEQANRHRHRIARSKSQIRVRKSDVSSRPHARDAQQGRLQIRRQVCFRGACSGVGET
eukprot:1352734-Alexandrium_andersonii.AAC.1